MSGYGAVDTKEGPSAANEEFGEANTYYLKEKPTTREEKVRKCIVTIFPIFIAVILLGFFGWWIVTGSGVLHEGEKGQKADYSRPAAAASTNASPPSVPWDEGANPPISPPVTTKSAPPPAPAPAPSKAAKTTGGGNTACQSNSACNDIGLVGDCCPTTEGIMLGCCS